MVLQVTGEIWHWRGPSPFHFVTVSRDACTELQAISPAVTYGWGMIPVTARIGSTTWSTSLFPKDETYVVPVKVSVRHAEGLVLGDVVTIHLVVVPAAGRRVDGGAALRGAALRGAGRPVAPARRHRACVSAAQRCARDLSRPLAPAPIRVARLAGSRHGGAVGACRPDACHKGLGTHAVGSRRNEAVTARDADDAGMPGQPGVRSGRDPYSRCAQPAANSYRLK